MRLDKVIPGLVTAVILAGAGVPGAWAQTPDEEAESLFETKCSLCHSIDRPKRKRKAREGWTTTVMRMKNRNGCPITDEQAQTIIEYLTKHHGPEE